MAVSNEERLKRQKERMRKLREERRNVGLSPTAVEGMSVESYARRLERNKIYKTTITGREGSKRYKKKYWEKCYRLYGGRPDQNLAARVKQNEVKLSPSKTGPL